MTNATSKTTGSHLPMAILSAGLITGFLDITGAILNHYINGGNKPSGIFRFIASGVFGKAAFTDGAMMLIWGGLFHFLIAIIFAAIFFLIYPKFKFLSKNTIVTGVLTGICIWLIMNLIVLPLSNTPAVPLRIRGAIVGMTILILAVGIPLSILAYRQYSKR